MVRRCEDGPEHDDVPRVAVSFLAAQPFHIEEGLCVSGQCGGGWGRGRCAEKGETSVVCGDKHSGRGDGSWVGEIEKGGREGLEGCSGNAE